MSGKSKIIINFLWWIYSEETITSKHKSGFKLLIIDFASDSSSAGRLLSLCHCSNLCAISSFVWFRLIKTIFECFCYQNNIEKRSKKLRLRCLLWNSQKWRQNFEIIKTLTSRKGSTLTDFFKEWFVRNNCKLQTGIILFPK